jgi:hypothetical protein
MPKEGTENLVMMQVWLPRWVKQAYRRAAFERETTMSKLAAGALIEDCADDPESPANQPAPQPRKPPPTVASWAAARL